MKRSIPNANVIKLLEQFDALNAKFAKKGLGQLAQPVVVAQDENRRGNVIIEFDASVKRLGDYDLIAVLDYTVGDMPVVRETMKGECPTEFFTNKSICEHCNANRQRNKCMVVKNVNTGEHKQIGSTCVEVFLGASAVALFDRMTTVMTMIDRHEHTEENDLGGGNGALYGVVVADYAAVVAALIRTEGKYVTKTQALEQMGDVSYATYYDAERRYANGTDEKIVTEADRATANAALEKAAGIEAPRNSFEHNCKVLANTQFISTRNTSMVAAIVGGYIRNLREEEARKQVANVGSMAGVLELLDRPKAAFPKIRLQVEIDGQMRPVVLAKAGKNSKYKGSVMLTDGGPYGDNIWYGVVAPDGQWQPSRKAAGITALTQLLIDLSARPAEVASAFGKATGQCCFCNKGLTDKRSVEVGYGKICAKNYALPW